MRRLVALLIFTILTLIAAISAHAQGIIVCPSYNWDYGLQEGEWGQLGDEMGPFGYNNVETKYENGQQVTYFHINQNPVWFGKYFIYKSGDRVGATYIVKISGDSIAEEYSCNPPFEPLREPTAFNNSVCQTSADANKDGVVDGKDYVLIFFLGSGDLNCNGESDQTDLDLWDSQYSP